MANGASRGALTVSDQRRPSAVGSSVAAARLAESKLWLKQRAASGFAAALGRSVLRKPSRKVRLPLPGLCCGALRSSASAGRTSFLSRCRMDFEVPLSTTDTLPRVHLCAAAGCDNVLRSDGFHSELSSGAEKIEPWGWLYRIFGRRSSFECFAWGR